MKSIKPFQFSQEIQGVKVKPLTESGRELRVSYNGLLSASGAADVIMHYGFGDSAQWQNIDALGMEKTSRGWEASVSMSDNQLNFCFHDTAYNWDNNNGLNWIYRIS